MCNDTTRDYNDLKALLRAESNALKDALGYPVPPPVSNPVVDFLQSASRVIWNNKDLIIGGTAMYVMYKFMMNSGRILLIRTDATDDLGKLRKNLTDALHVTLKEINATPIGKGHARLAKLRRTWGDAIRTVMIDHYGFIKEIGANRDRADFNTRVVNDTSTLHYCNKGETFMDKANLVKQGRTSYQDHACQTCPIVAPFYMEFVDFFLSDAELADLVPAGGSGAIMAQRYKPGLTRFGKYVEDGVEKYEQTNVCTDDYCLSYTSGGSYYDHSYRNWQDEGFFIGKSQVVMYKAVQNYVMDGCVFTLFLLTPMAPGLYDTSDPRFSHYVPVERVPEGPDHCMVSPKETVFYAGRKIIQFRHDLVEAKELPTDLSLTIFRLRTARQNPKWQDEVAGRTMFDNALATARSNDNLWEFAVGNEENAYRQMTRMAEYETTREKTWIKSFTSTLKMAWSRWARDRSSWFYMPVRPPVFEAVVIKGGRSDAGKVKAIQAPAKTFRSGGDNTPPAPGNPTVPAPKAIPVKPSASNNAPAANATAATTTKETRRATPGPRVRPGVPNVPVNNAVPPQGADDGRGVCPPRSVQDRSGNEALPRRTGRVGRVVQGTEGPITGQAVPQVRSNQTQRPADHIPARGNSSVVANDVCAAPRSSSKSSARRRVMVRKGQVSSRGGRRAPTVIRAGRRRV